MLSNMIVLSALAAAPAVNAIGSAIVVNACNYEVKMCNVPASGGGYEQIDKMLQPNETYTQEFTELSNGSGWAIKLSDDETLDHILQYEYTTHQDGIIWYDLSQVDGNPWYGNWQITADSENCNPKQQAYRYANDDAYGMQSCPDNSDITVTLCSGEEYNDELAAEASASVAAASQANTIPWAPLGAATQSYAEATSAPAETTSAPAYSAPASSVSSAPASSSDSSDSDDSDDSENSGYAVRFNKAGWAIHNKHAAPATTLATIASKSNGVVVTHTVYETIYAREAAPTQRAHRRHAHVQHS